MNKTSADTALTLSRAALRIHAALAAAGLLAADRSVPGPFAPIVAPAMALDRPPHLLLLLVDRLSLPDDPAIWRACMPQLAALQDRGVHFTGYHSAASAGAPSRSTLLTGL